MYDAVLACKFMCGMGDAVSFPVDSCAVCTWRVGYGEVWCAECILQLRSVDGVEPFAPCRCTATVRTFLRAYLFCTTDV